MMWFQIGNIYSAEILGHGSFDAVRIFPFVVCHSFTIPHKHIATRFSIGVMSNDDDEDFGGSLDDLFY